MDLWEWFTTTAPAGAIINALGLGALAALFASDRVITRGQHARRISDLEDAHRLLKAEWDVRYAEMKESRDFYRNARNEERDRADRATSQLVEVSKLAELTVHAIESLGEATREETPK